MSCWDFRVIHLKLKFSFFFFFTVFLAGPLCSVLVEHFGCRATVMFGGVLSGFGMAVSSFSHSIVDLYITTGVITGQEVMMIS